LCILLGDLLSDLRINRQRLVQQDLLIRHQAFAAELEDGNLRRRPGRAIASQRRVLRNGIAPRNVDHVEIGRPQDGEQTVAR
jgi:hypothetical protein